MQEGRSIIRNKGCRPVSSPLFPSSPKLAGRNPVPFPLAICMLLPCLHIYSIGQDPPPPQGGRRKIVAPLSSPSCCPFNFGLRVTREDQQVGARILAVRRARAVNENINFDEGTACLPLSRPLSQRSNYYTPALSVHVRVKQVHASVISTLR